MRLRHAVAWNRKADGEIVWCFTRHNTKPDPFARMDRTLCGQYVMFRGGSAKLEEPTCPDCLAKLRKNK